MKIIRKLFIASLLVVSFPIVSHAAQNTSGYAWGENIGWVNIATSTATWGVSVSDTELTGYMYAENVGWISLNCNQPVLGTNTCASNNYKVVNNGQGRLSGYAWGENVGWIDFGSAGVRTWGVSIGTTTNIGEFLGYAYGENIGWISFNCLNTGTCATNNYKANTTWRVSGGGTYSISGTVKYYGVTKPINRVLVTLENGLGAQVDSTYTDSSGNYNFSGINGGQNYTLKVASSTDQNQVNSGDQISIKNYILNRDRTNSVFKLIAGDVNGSGGLNSADQVTIKNYILRRSTPSDTWKFYDSSASITTSNYLQTNLRSRTISNLSSNITGQDFVGVKMGDVNGSWGI